MYWKTQDEAIDFNYIFDEFIYFKDLIKNGLQKNEKLSELELRLEKLYTIFCIVSKKCCWYSHLTVFPNGIGGLSNERFEHLHKVIWDIIDHSIQKGFNFNEFWFHLFGDVPEEFYSTVNNSSENLLTSPYIIDCFFDNFNLNCKMRKLEDNNEQIIEQEMDLEEEFDEILPKSTYTFITKNNFDVPL